MCACEQGYMIKEGTENETWEWVLEKERLDILMWRRRWRQVIEKETWQWDLIWDLGMQTCTDGNDNWEEKNQTCRYEEKGWDIYANKNENTVVPYLVVTLANRLTGVSINTTLGASIATLTIISVETWNDCSN